MLIKHIICDVAEEKKELFSIAQKEWMAISNVPGLLWQLGAWKGNDEAHIWGIWSDEFLYEQFVKKNHDAIYNTNRQMETHDSISISFMKVDEIKGMIDFIASIEDGQAFTWLIDDQSCSFNIGDDAGNEVYHFVESWLVAGSNPYT